MGCTVLEQAKEIDDALTKAVTRNLRRLSRAKQSTWDRRTQQIEGHPRPRDVFYLSSFVSESVFMATLLLSWFFWELFGKLVR